MSLLPSTLLILMSIFVILFQQLCLVTQILEALNKGEIPSTSSLVEVFNKAILERCLKLYREEMDQLQLPLSETMLLQAHHQSREQAMKVFDEQHFGRHHAKQSVTKLDEEILMV